MNILLALLPVSLLLLGLAIAAFLWAVRRGQFDDLDTPPLDILGEDDAPTPPRGGSQAPPSEAGKSPPTDGPRDRSDD